MLRSLWRSLVGTPPASPPPPAPPLALAHASLGELHGTTDELKGRIRFGHADVELSVTRDDQSLVDSLAFAGQLVADLDRIHRIALDCIADDYLALYNDDWRSSAAASADGRGEHGEPLPLSRAAFIAHQRLTDVTITGNELSTLWFDCGDLFGGHGFAVKSFAGVSFAEPSAEMIG